MTKAAVVLFSGGLDSTAALYWARDRFDKVFPLTFDYGQRHSLEVRLAAWLCRKLGLPHAILKVDLGQVGGSALTDKSIPVPLYKDVDKLPSGPPATYVPFRNGILLALTAAWAEARGIHSLVAGFNIIDSPEYPDTRPDFVKAMEDALNKGTKAVFTPDKWTIHAPFLKLRKAEIIREGLALGADFSYALSCYLGRERPCGKCSACLLRQKAWQEMGMTDPLVARLNRGRKK